PLHVLGFRLFFPSGIPVPVHAHLRNLPVPRFTENRPPRVHLLPCPTAPECAAKLRRKPRPRRVNLARRKIGFGLIQRDVLPIVPDRRHPPIGSAERRLEKHRVLSEDGADRVCIAALPPLAERIDQRSILAIHARKYTPRRAAEFWLPAGCR